jgi:hypothetical protein
MPASSQAATSEICRNLRGCRKTEPARAAADNERLGPSMGNGRLEDRQCCPFISFSGLPTLAFDRSRF